MLVHGEQAFEFYEVVRPGDIITSWGAISNIENKEKLDLVSLEVLSKNQNGREVCKATYTFAIRKRV
jgi:acyl dehydratase